MNNPQPKMKKSKLVTVISNDDSGFGTFFPPFEYDGSSDSLKTKVKVSFPSYRNNLMFYEHFDNEYDTSPSRLSFMYVGGETDYNFQEYVNVTTVDISDQFATVQCIFYIVSKLPKCKEVRIYLTKKNIFLSEEEQLARDVFPPCQHLSHSIKVLKVVQLGDVPFPIKDPNMGEHSSRTRFDNILFFAYNLTPNLEVFIAEGVSSAVGSTIYSINYFCENKKNLPKHVFTVKNGKASCMPVSRKQPSSSTGNTSLSSNLANIKKMGSEIRTANNENVNRGNPIPLGAAGDPRLRRVIKPEKDLNFHADQPISDRDGSEIICFTPSPKSSSPVKVVTISEEEESTCRAPKKAKIENLVQKVELPPPTPSTSSKASTLSCDSIPAWLKVPMDQASNSVGNIGSSFQEWEHSSSSDEEKNNVRECNEMNQEEIRCNVLTVNPKTEINLAEVPLAQTLTNNYLESILENAGLQKKNKSIASRYKTEELRVSKGCKIAFERLHRD